MLETSLTKSVDSVSAATYSDSIEDPYYYHNINNVDQGFINDGDLTPAIVEEKNDEAQDGNKENELVAWIRNLIVPTAHAAEFDIAAQLISVSPKAELVIEPGKAITIEAKFKNTGNYTWTKDSYNFVALATVDPIMRDSDFEHKFWEESFRAARIVESSVKPGEIATVRFALQAPSTKGEYIEKFQLVARRLDWIEGGEITLYFNVGNVATKIIHQPAIIAQPVAHIASTQYNDQNNPIPNSNINNSSIINQKTNEEFNFGPTMRVGLYDTKQPITLTANGDYFIKDENNNILATKLAGQGTSAVFDWMNKRYIVSSDSFNINIKEYLRFELVDPANSYFTITSLDARPDFNPKVNYNDFRYILELRYTPATQKLWMINELPMEYYLMGVSETHKYAPDEFLKSMAIAARTYAKYHEQNQTKHATEFFTVDSVYDQVYRGAAIEEILTDYKRAVEETNGIVAMYDNKIAITPYFASSDGRTRSFAEVWTNEVPWLQSVSCEYEVVDGELFGHGVGLSAVDAMRRANDGADYVEILQHYYTGIDLVKIY
ncbi:MAG: SpoIID/LytB domain-containing protein [Candidatus Komeilibacteria bacterium]